jgi:hypothetical protein
MGEMERSGWYDAGDLLDPHYHAECRDLAIHDRMPVILDPDNYDLWLILR